MKKYILFPLCVFFQQGLAQQENQFDSTKVLTEVVVKAYNYDRPLLDVPAAVGVITQPVLERFNNSSLLPALNTIPGVRMEQRSPGSYRLSIRGSSLRSPFGVRNVKVYWNGIPFTDPGGNTYINLFDFNSIQQIEVIKGPGSSLYGAGTGGVLLLNSEPALSNDLTVSALAGSFGLLRYAATARIKNENAQISVHYGHQQADGYRAQTRMARDVLQLQSNFSASSKSTLAANILYADLFYETPGGLTQSQSETNPRAARPTAGSIPGASEQQAAVTNKTFYSALQHTYTWSPGWSNQTGLCGSFSQFQNPSIRNYERRVEQGIGGRTDTQYNFSKGTLNFGAEFQYGFSPISVYENNTGSIGDLQSIDEVSSSTYFLFTQAEFFLPADFFLTLGASINKLKISLTGLSVTPAIEEERNFKPFISPRIALLKKINSAISAYASYSQGYSPPTVAEVFPSTGIFDRSLNPERGQNLEVGFRGSAMKETVRFDVALYDFSLRETIVIRRDRTQAGDPEYFVNAGKTSQRGAEVQASWNPTIQPSSIFTAFTIWSSYAWNNFIFKDYVKDVLVLTGNTLTGTAPHTLVVGMDIKTKLGMYINATGTYASASPVNDENTAYADAYTLVTSRLGYRKAYQRWTLDVFAGADNILDERYSLGNDLNAVGGRYFNPAPSLNFFGGVQTSLRLN